VFKKIPENRSGMCACNQKKMTEKPTEALEGDMLGSVGEVHRAYQKVAPAQDNAGGGQDYVGPRLRGEVSVNRRKAKVWKRETSPILE